jgi:prepilin-type N-terminal cleavage/methylation domain-containing protein
MIGVNCKRNKARRRGFTLVEVLIVMALFGIIVGLLADIFVRTTGFGRQIVMRAKLQADARNSLEAIARAVRVSDFDYASWGGTLPAQPNSELRLKNPVSGLASRIRRETTDIGCYGDGMSFPCITVSTDDGGTWTPLSPKSARIDSLLFYAAPSLDPFLYDGETGIFASDQQPSVTIIMTVHSPAGRAYDEWIFTLQTTMTPRLYLR